MFYKASGSSLLFSPLSRALGRSALTQSPRHPAAWPMLRIGQLASGEPAIGPDVVLSGFGIELTTSGTLYMGQFREGLRHGRGALSGPDAQGNRVTFDGTWRKGVRDGRGVEFSPFRAHPVICAGVWKNGSKHGAFRCLLNGSKHASMVKVALTELATHGPGRPCALGTRLGSRAELCRPLDPALQPPNNSCRPSHSLSPLGTAHDLSHGRRAGATV